MVQSYVTVKYELNRNGCYSTFTFLGVLFLIQNPKGLEHPRTRNSVANRPL